MLHMIVTGRWTAPMLFNATTECVKMVVMDVVPERCAGQAGPTPMETVLGALTACSGMDVSGILMKMRAPLEGLAITAEADRAAEHPKVFTRIHLRYDVWGAGLQPEQVRRAVALSLDKYCSVAAMLRQTAPITHEIVVAEKEEDLVEAAPVTAA